MGFFRILILFFLLQNFDWFCLVLQHDLHSNYTVNYAYLESRKDRENILRNFQVLVPQMSINSECGSNVRMPHQLLGGFFVHTGFIKQRSIGMPELMQCAADPRFSLEFLPAVPADIVRYWLPPVREKIMVGPYRGGCLPGCLFYVLGTAGIFAALQAVLL